MAPLVIALTLGIALVIAGAFKRSQQVGRWLIVGGVTIIVIAVLVGGYSDVKTGFVDALRD